MTDFAAAKKLAAENKRPILLVFSGSDWCIWCKRLDKEVFATEEFAEYAEKNIVFVYADFPRRKQLSSELKKHNEELKKMYKISGYPTVYLLNADGSVILKTGYQRGGAKKYIKHLKSAIAKAK
jgi:thioredoxin-related protein